MMDGRGKSDEAIVALKRANHEAQALREPVERRAEAKGNAGQTNTRQTQSRESVTQGLERIREVAKAKEKERFTALFHHLSLEHLEMAFFELEEKAAAGADGLTWHSYAAELEGNLEDLHSRLHRGAYRPLPSRRVYIPKPDGRQRPLAIAALEDKIVQRATAAVLNAIYE
jgi:RNA-directed DNA polymerase